MNPLPTPGPFDGLFDDAAVFPPGDLPLPQAVPAHLAHQDAWYAELVGPFLCGANRLADLAALAEPGMPVALVLPGGPEQLAPALAATAGLTVVGVELAAGARAALAAFAQLPDGVAGAVELPRGPGLFEELDVLAGTPYRAKYRTGGLAAEAFPTEAELAAFIRACAERDLPFKCTAGLHNAVRHTDHATGFEHHGFLNVLLAAADPARAEEVLAERSGKLLASAVLDLTPGQIEQARSAFTAFGTCSIAEPLDDLAALGLLPHQETP
ncbi:hypothetical protein CFP65_6092 [Kitasatospora sp. MMS16-BH015]|uniref:hypothetical protein n=1 Tax=Kitasatospora sp. MMS16-BH015 TaxID=2018025 RepID=UPI000CA17F8E|nr:hypothetical protein [Kitasatospora sp. MMS16-BH015]AUG80761.1 hypothetical protein CFP65_6092 [Kitasatospora sp. MMS16-BH015]